MKIYTTEVTRNPWAQQVRVSRTKNGRWVIDRVLALSELPANTFTCWEHAEWTGNAWSNEEHLQRIKEQQHN
jgi:hypothetical protein